MYGVPAWQGYQKSSLSSSRKPSTNKAVGSTCTAKCQLPSKINVQGSGFRVQGAGFRVQGAGCRVQVAVFRVQGSGCRVHGAGCRVQGSGLKALHEHSRRIHLRLHIQRLGFRVQSSGVQGSGLMFCFLLGWCGVRGAGCGMGGAGRGLWLADSRQRGRRGGSRQ